jgi:hypothetical protein
MRHWGVVPGEGGSSPSVPEGRRRVRAARNAGVTPSGAAAAGRQRTLARCAADKFPRSTRGCRAAIRSSAGAGPSGLRRIWPQQFGVWTPTPRAPSACTLSESQEPCALLALALHRAGRGSEVLSRADATENLPENIWGRYNLACFYALRDAPHAALAHLQGALRLGFADFLILSRQEVSGKAGAIREHPPFLLGRVHGSRGLETIRKRGWCRRSDSNRHGVAPAGF